MKEYKVKIYREYKVVFTDKEYQQAVVSPFGIDSALQSRARNQRHLEWLADQELHSTKRTDDLYEVKEIIRG